MHQKMEGLEEDVKANFQALAQEFETARQMAKLCVGRQGNHFPILLTEYFHGSIRDIGTRENVDQRSWPGSRRIDSEAFCRTLQEQPSTASCPTSILLPSYGESGVCWEPFDKFNRATSRGRIAIPMYPKSLQPGRGHRRRRPALAGGQGEGLSTTGWRRASRATTTSGSPRRS
ncbi:MAG: hypothetical protein MZV70_22300 [Desulfobacterales bacterium]|nr:hypothetical protein [Desulfobacterales bacterium]